MWLIPAEVSVGHALAGYKGEASTDVSSTKSTASVLVKIGGGVDSSSLVQFYSREKGSLERGR